MRTRFTFAAIATVVMISCTQQDPISAGSSSTGTSSIPVSVAFDKTAMSISDSSNNAVAIVTHKDGTKDTTDLEIGNGSISGNIESDDVSDTLKVDIEVYDNARNLKYKVVQLVKKEGNKKYEKVDGSISDVAKIGKHEFDKRDPLKLGNDKVISKGALVNLVPYLIGNKKIDPVFLDMISQMIIARNWTEKDLYIIEEFFKLLLETKGLHDSVIISGDTVRFDTTGAITDPFVSPL